MTLEESARLAAAHETNASRLDAVQASLVDSASPPSPSPATPPRPSHPSHSTSPTSALFHRKPKAAGTAAKRKARAKDIVKEARAGELGVISDSIGVGELGNTAHDHVVDLADDLLAQLDGGAEPGAEIDAVPTVVRGPTASASEKDGRSSLATSSTRSGESGQSSSFSQRLHHVKDGIMHSISPPTHHHHHHPPHETAPAPRKVSRGQARKEKRAVEEESQREQARQEVAASSGPDAAEQERAAFERICSEHHLTIVEMPPDGHCLFSAVADQLNLLKPVHGKTFDYHQTRRAAADYMRDHPDDFMPYLTAEDIGGPGDATLDDDKFAKYCTMIEQTGEWGGQTEILALSHTFTMPIEVYAADVPVVKNGTDYASESSPARLAYYHKSFGLGAHYNSLHPVADAAS